MRYNILKLFFEHLIVNIRNFSCNKVYAAERMTVNHDVAGSSPAGGANYGADVSFTFSPLI